MRRLENYREVMLFRGIQSVMSNARENGATSLTVSLKEEGNQIIASVEDNGRGFGTGQLSMDSNNPEAIGLGALQERVMLVGGALNVSNVPGGTRVEIEIPSGPAVQESNDADD
jgi:signal transduction histidine kinase